jgi:hypothetical protein
MNVAKRVLIAITLLTAAVPAASAQQGSCIVIVGIGNVTPGSCEEGSVGGTTVMITLTGSVDIVTRDLANWAIVSCWVCESGSCGSSSVYGPSRTEWELPAAGSSRSLIDWTVRFRFDDNALSTGTATFPTLASYYCRVELESRSRGVDSGIATGPPTVPDFFANYVHARAESNSQLVVELQGTFAQPVSNRR